MDKHKILAKKFNHRQYSYDDTEGLIIYDDLGDITEEMLVVAEQEIIKEEKSIKYLQDRKADPEMPSLEEKVEIMFETLLNNNNSKLLELKKRIEQINFKYPAPIEE